MTNRNMEYDLLAVSNLSSTVNNVRDIMECSDLEEALQTNVGKAQIENLQNILSGVLSVGDNLLTDPTVSDRICKMVEEVMGETKDLLSVIEDLHFRENETSDCLMEQE